MLLNEIDAAQMRRTMAADPDRCISAATVLECCLVLHGKVGTSDKIVECWVDQFLFDGQLVLEPVTTEQLAVSRRAYVTCGKGMGHPAQLNFGDCFSYALAKTLEALLLYKGGDFGKTDIRSAL